MSFDYSTIERTHNHEVIAIGTLCMDYLFFRTTSRSRFSTDKIAADSRSTTITYLNLLFKFPEKVADDRQKVQ